MEIKSGAIDDARIRLVALAPSVNLNPRCERDFRRLRHHDAFARVPLAVEGFHIRVGGQAAQAKGRCAEKAYVLVHGFFPF